MANTNKADPNAVKVKLLKMSPSNFKRQKSSLEEGHLNISLTDIGIEIRGIIDLIRPDRRVAIVFPSKAYPRPIEKGEKPTKVSVQTVGFTSSDLWRSCRESIDELVLQNYDKRQQRWASK